MERQRLLGHDVAWPTSPSTPVPPEPHNDHRVASFGAELTAFAAEHVEHLLGGHLEGGRVPPAFAGHRVNPDVPADLAFTLGWLHAAGTTTLGDLEVTDVLRSLLSTIDGPGTHTFFSYRVAETLARFGTFDDNPLVVGLSADQRTAVDQACDSSDWLALLDGGLPRNYRAVLARCELARRSLGLPVDESVLDDLLARTRAMLSSSPGGYLDDSEDAASARYDIYSVDVYLFCEPLAPFLDGVWEAGLPSAVDLVESAGAANGAAISWGRSTGALALCHTLELAAVALRHGVGDDSAAWLRRAMVAATTMQTWFAPDGLINAHQHRSPYGYRGPARRLQMTLDCLGKVAWSGAALQALASPVADVRPSSTAATRSPLDRVVAFERAGDGTPTAGVWCHRGDGLDLTVALVGPTHSDYQTVPSAPGLFEVPVDRSIVTWLPAVWTGEKAWCPGGRPSNVTAGPGRLDVTWTSDEGTARLGVEALGRTLRLSVGLDLDRVPDAITVALPEATGRPLHVVVEGSDIAAADRIDTSGIKEWRSFWGELPTVHQLTIRTAASTQWSVAITPVIRLLSEDVDHHYTASLYRPTAPAVAVTQLPGRALGDRGRRMEVLARTDVYHLHWPEWLFGNDLTLAEAFLDDLAAADVRLVWTQHNLRPHLDAPAFDDLYQLVAAAADGVAHHSAWGLERARGRLGYRDDCVHRIVRHGHFGNLVDRTLDRAAAEHALGLAPCGLRIGIVGAPRRDKDVIGFAEAFAATQRTDAQLLITSLGDGEVAPDDPRITAWPYSFTDREDFDRVLATLDVLALPFDPEGDMLTTGVVGDALGAEIPALVTSWGYLTESLGAGGIAIGDAPASWAEAIDALDTRTIDEAAGALADLRAASDWDVVAVDLVNLLDAVLRAPRP